MNKYELKIKKLFDLSNKVVILTGASGTLGKRFADGLCQAGADIILADKNYAKCKELEIILRKKYNTNVISIKTDVTSRNSVKSMLKTSVSTFTKIDVLINCAIYQEGKKERSYSFEDFPQSLWEKIIAVNVTGTFLTCQEVGKLMIKQKEGVIINISSIYGVVAPDQRIYGKSGVNSTIAYATSKSSILNFSRYLASYWQKKGIRVNTLTLGGVEMGQSKDFLKNYSDRTMLGRMAHEDDYVGAILFLSSDASSYMTGSNLIIDGGWTAW